METVIVTNSMRQRVDISDTTTYVYIPLTDEEAKIFAPKIRNPCWRITVLKEG